MQTPRCDSRRMIGQEVFGSSVEAESTIPRWDHRRFSQREKSWDAYRASVSATSCSPRLPLDAEAGRCSLRVLEATRRRAFQPPFTRADTFRPSSRRWRDGIAFGRPHAAPALSEKRSSCGAKRFDRFTRIRQYDLRLDSTPISMFQRRRAILPSCAFGDSLTEE